MIFWRIYISLKYEGAHRSSPDKEPVNSFLEKYPELRWINWCDDHYADLYFDINIYDEEKAWNYFKSLSWVSRLVQDPDLEKIEMEPKLCRVTVFPTLLDKQEEK